MCKLFIAVGTLTREQTLAALAEVNELFVKSEKDGFGFLAAARDGKVATGHYLNPNAYCGFKSAALPGFIAGPQAEVGHLASVDVLVAHGRTSTNLVNLANVHPFHYNGFDLAHNGVVHWTGEASAEPKPVCDTEKYLHWLVKSKLDWQGASKLWSGSAALALYERATRTLTVARDVSSLYIARRAARAGWIMATSAAQLTRVCKAAGIALATRPVFFPKQLITFKRGKLVRHAKWKGLGAYRSAALFQSMSAAAGKKTFSTPEGTVRHGAGTWERKETSPGKFDWVKFEPSAPRAPFTPMSALEVATWKGGTFPPHELDYAGSNWKAAEPAPEVACGKCAKGCIECGECDCKCICFDNVG